MLDYAIIHEDDIVGVALKDLDKGYIYDSVYGKQALRENIPAGHKFALRDIRDKEAVIKYGDSIGYALGDIAGGYQVHTKNLRTGLGDILSYSYKADYKDVKVSDNGHFLGYRRKDGKAGIRNQIWIIPTVGCVNSIASALERQASFLVDGKLEAIIAFPHPYGCSQLGDDQDNTLKLLSGLIKHPNAAGVLVLGLGCENSNIDVLKTYLGQVDEERVKFLVCQEVEDETLEGTRLLEELAEYAKQFGREPINISELIVGLKCGGSDGLSGITANPLVGDFSDALISNMGTTILTEVPEMFGAEEILMKRCISEKVFNKTVAMINGFKQYYIRYEQPIYENPSPGNKEGGITTLEEKALGCTQKAGSSPVVDVLSYSEHVTHRGLNLLSAPGNDLVATTALAASGAQLVLFTTGRGTPFGSCVPTVKISSNSKLVERKNNWIDFDAGRLLSGTDRSVLTEELYSYVIEVASGRKVKAEESGFYDIAIWKQGVTL
ncbi:MAG: altronate dehydratase [Clostridiales bacterium]|jgi:altronate hydrolase|nr:altronate dehydratase [Clostridiales bacterium]